jgi:hypothetical protein
MTVDDLDAVVAIASVGFPDEAAHEKRTLSGQLLVTVAATG